MKRVLSFVVLVAALAVVFAPTANATPATGTSTTSSTAPSPLLVQPMVTGTKTAYITTKYLDYLDEHAWTFQSGYTWSWYAGHVENNYFQPYYCWAIDGWYSFDNHDTGGGWVTWNGNSHGEWHAWEKEQVHYAVLKVGVVQTWYITNDFYVYADGHYTWHHSE